MLQRAEHKCRSKESLNYNPTRAAADSLYTVMGNVHGNHLVPLGFSFMYRSYDIIYLSHAGEEAAETSVGRSCY